MNMGLVKEGHVFEDGAEIAELKEENRQLRRELSDARAELTRARRDNEQAVASLRKTLTPLYRGLQAVFGELDAFGESEDAPATGGRAAAAWEPWKQKLDKGCAKIIDALLTHGEMTRRQLAVATAYSPQNVSNLVSKLNGLSLVVKNGDRIALRQL